VGGGIEGGKPKWLVQIKAALLCAGIYILKAVGLVYLLCPMNYS